MHVRMRWVQPAIYAMHMHAILHDAAPTAAPKTRAGGLCAAEHARGAGTQRGLNAAALLYRRAGTCTLRGVST